MSFWSRLFRRPESRPSELSGVLQELTTSDEVKEAATKAVDDLEVYWERIQEAADIKLRTPVRKTAPRKRRPRPTA